MVVLDVDHAVIARKAWIEYSEDGGMVRNFMDERMIDLVVVIKW
ncbi:MAG: hypothetical protein ACJAR1_001231 [Rubritalea sp.]